MVFENVLISVENIRKLLMSQEKVVSLLKIISKGQQVGLNIDYECQGEKLWLQMAIQLYKGDFVSHITLIPEKDMAGEDFKLYKTTAHATIDDAIAFLRSCSPISFSFDNFKPFKGQKVFYPEGEEIIRESANEK